MELKFIMMASLISLSGCSNRTFMELKWMWKDNASSGDAF